uniref:Cadherin-1 n=1 Tax=Sinocyclocheilus rhinocerous TaxID=307959 RepID=A0A673N6L6_9TELE
QYCCEDEEIHSWKFLLCFVSVERLKYFLVKPLLKYQNHFCMIRRKRDWLIPHVSIAENDKGPFPKEVVKVMIYKITGAGAGQPPKGLFTVDKYTGKLWVTKSLDREETEEYILTTHASAQDQSFIETPVKLTIKVIDQNDNKPLCTQDHFMGEVPERAKQNEPIIQVMAKYTDDPETANGIVRYKLVRQEPNRGVFHIDPASGVIGLATMGILDREVLNLCFGPVATLQRHLRINVGFGLDFEQTNSFSLLGVVKNEVPFAIPLAISTATVTITVQDVNEPPATTSFMCCDVRYKLLQDWLEITVDTGLIKVRSSLDREASLCGLLCLCVSVDDEPATGTGTLVIKLLDVNDNAPVLEEHRVPMCLIEPKPVRLTITDPDGPGNGPPFIIELNTEYQSNWTIISNSSSRTGLPLRRLALGEYSLVLHMYNSKRLYQDSSIRVEVCDCKVDDVTCLLLLLLLLLKRRCGRKVQWEQFNHTEEDRDNILCYNEEGGGEQDQVHKLFHISCSVNFTFVKSYQCICCNLCTADDDHFVAPYDSMLVFAHEGEGSISGSLSSLQSSIGDGDKDFQHLQNWGPQFRRLADMFAGGEEE